MKQFIKRLFCKHKFHLFGYYIENNIKTEIFMCIKCGRTYREETIL